MSTQRGQTAPPRPVAAPQRPGGPRWRPAPLIRAPEQSRTLFLVTLAAALVPLAAGVFFFGYHAAMVAALSIGGCAVLEWACFRVTQTPALFGRSHALLTGALLALTLPAFAPWYVPLVGAAFAIIVGKAIFGGVGHFLWQPALVGRLAVAVMFGTTLNPAAWPVLAPTRVVTGDIAACRPVEAGMIYRSWSRGIDRPGTDEGYRLPRPVTQLRTLTDPTDPQHESITAALTAMPAIRDAMIGATGGGIGETSAVILVVVGLYLIRRHCVSWILPTAFIGSAAVVVAVAPVYLLSGGGVRTVWLPASAEGFEAGLTYVGYHLGTGELLLAAMLLAPEMTSRPVTPRGQAIFGIGCGVVGMLLRLYVVFPLACYTAVLLMNTATPLLDRFTRPRVLGRRPWWRRLLRRESPFALPAD